MSRKAKRPLTVLSQATPRMMRDHPSMNAKGDTDFLMVGIDFGTSYTGISHLHGIHSSNLDKIQAIVSWPKGDNSTTEKVPTKLVYGLDGLITKWGYQVEPRDQSLQCIKLQLDPDQQLPDWADRPFLLRQLAELNKDAVHVVADYLKKILEVAQEVLIGIYTAEVFNTTDIRFVMTVPAVWSDKAKYRTLQAAELAGIPKNRLKTVTEPEAAAIYALSATTNIRPVIGDVYVVCDAGGGTVDVLTYVVLGQNPLQLQEVIAGDGGLYGSAFINSAFERLLEHRLGAELFDTIRWRKPIIWRSIINEFEKQTKRQFDAFVDEDDLELSLPGVEDDAEKRIEHGHIYFTVDEIRALFDPFIAQVIDLVDNQRKRATHKGKMPKTLICVGGFSQSEYFFKCLQNKFEHLIGGGIYGDAVPQGRAMSVINLQNRWTAVARGAVIRGLPGNEAVESRIARCHYGVTINAQFDPKLHSPVSKKFDELENCWVAEDQMEWLVNQGQTIDTGVPILKDYHRCEPAVIPEFEEILYYSEEEEPPKELNDKVHVLCRLRIKSDEATLGPKAWKTRFDRDGNHFRSLIYYLGFHLDSGSLHFEMRANGRVHKTVEANFE